jgi:flagellar basal-body rod protein FlgC
MGFFNILDISAAGMDVQQARLEVATSNLANSRSTRTASGEVYKPLAVVIGSTAHSAESTSAAQTRLSRPVVSQVVEQNVAPRLIHDPGHPDADERGFVALPGVDPIASMLDLMSISRHYEANLRAFDITRTLLQRTIDIGGRR